MPAKMDDYGRLDGCWQGRGGSIGEEKRTVEGMGR